MSEKILKVVDSYKSVDEIYVCKKCLTECEDGSNDYDSFFYCPRCDQSDFHGKLEVELVEKVSECKTYLRPVENPPDK